ncbi:MAG: ABC transporter permease [Lachnospiraceae bacterium]
MNDLKSRFRRSKLGMLWTVLQPLLLTVILSFVFSTIFRQPMGEYSLYVLSGIVVWDMIQSSVVGGGNSLFGSEQYIRQFNHPITIYTLRYSIMTILTFLLELVALIIWVLFFEPSCLVLAFFTLPLTLCLYFIFVWSAVTIAGYFGAKYRDYPQIMLLAMQMLYYVSPVFFKVEMFTSSVALKRMLDLNPITHLLNLIRSPFVYMQMPSLFDYCYVIITDIIVVALAIWVNKKNSQKVIFYL